MPTEVVTVRLRREAGSDEKWGFDVDGGSDRGGPLIVSEVMNANRSIHYLVLTIDRAQEHRGNDGLEGVGLAGERQRR